MKLVLIRHCKAYEAEQDPDRNLTKEGIEEANHIAKALQKTNWQFSFILTSPINRALQTANILQSILHCNVIPKKELSPNSALENYLYLLKEHSISENLIFVLHMPDIARIAALILKIPEHNIYFSTGSAIGINIQKKNDSVEGILVFFYQPYML